MTADPTAPAPVAPPAPAPVVPAVPAAGPGARAALLMLTDGRFPAATFPAVRIDFTSSCSPANCRWLMPGAASPIHSASRPG